MKGFSSAVSIAIHVTVGAAVLFGAAKTGRSDPARPAVVPMVFQPPSVESNGQGALPIPAPVTVASPDIRFIAGLTTLPKTGAPMPSFAPVYTGSMSGPRAGQFDGFDSLLTEEHAEVLTGPLPVYPDLLRQAGVQGRVVLEAVVDTTGRVFSQSISIVSATNPGFVAPARQALLATLFRPARVGGKATRMLVRIPYEFAIRNATGRGR